MKILIFKCTRDVITADKRLKAEGIERKIIPVPRSVSPLCGMAVELEDALLDQAEKVLSANQTIDFTVFDRKDVTL